MEKEKNSQSKNVVLCGASAYEEKYYLNESFKNLPESIRQELQIMCVLFTEKVGGVFLLEFDEDGNLQFHTECRSDDFDYDDIGSELEIKDLRSSKEDLLRSLELYYKILIGKIKPEEL